VLRAIALPLLDSGQEHGPRVGGEPKDVPFRIFAVTYEDTVSHFDAGTVVNTATWLTEHTFILSFCYAGDTGFEPVTLLHVTAFKAAAIDHSANHPYPFTRRHQLPFQKRRSRVY
jgi:hypothetical protein